MIRRQVTAVLAGLTVAVSSVSLSVIMPMSASAARCSPAELAANPAACAGELGPFAENFIDIRQVDRGEGDPRVQRGGSSGSFVSRCGRNENGHFNSDNFIVAPGVSNGAHHTHDYVGNLSTDAFSTDESLSAAGTTCRQNDRSTYFWPVLRQIDPVGSRRSASPSPSPTASAPEDEQDGQNQDQDGQNQDGQNQDDPQNPDAQDPGQDQDAQDPDAQDQDAQDQGAQNQDDAQNEDAQNQDTQDQNAQNQDAQNEDVQSRGAQSVDAQNPQDPQEPDAQDPDAQNPDAQNPQDPEGQDPEAENPEGDNNQNQRRRPTRTPTPSASPTQDEEEDEGEASPSPSPTASGEPGGSADGNVGRILRPAAVDIRFRGNAFSRVTAMPRFLRLLMGDAKSATNGGANALAKWTCSGFTDRLTTQYPLCPRGSQVMRIQDFPSCWDGNNIDSANHRTHVLYPDENGRCAEGTRAIPQLRITLTYRVPAGQSFALDSFPEQLHNPITDHSDFANVMPNNLMNTVVSCINRGRRC